MSRSARGPIGLRIEHPRIPDGVMGTEVLAHSRVMGTEVLADGVMGTEVLAHSIPNDDGESSPEAMIRRFRTFVASEKERLGLKPQEHIEQPSLPAQTQSGDVMTSPDFE